MSHAPFAPSAADRWLNCSMAGHYAATLPEKPAGAAAEEGTRKHHQAAKHLLIGDDSTCAGTQLYLDTVREIPGRHLVEKRVTIVEGQCWGTSDCIVIGREPTVVDFKWGKHPVPAVGNPQLKLYALGAAQLVGERGGWSMLIVQPNASAGMPVKRWAIDFITLRAFRDQALRAIDQTLSDARKPTAGDWCRWCPGQHLCIASWAKK